MICGEPLDPKRICRTFSYCTALMRCKQHPLGQFPTGCPPFDKEVYAEIWDEAAPDPGPTLSAHPRIPGRLTKPGELASPCGSYPMRDNRAAFSISWHMRALQRAGALAVDRFGMSR